jgi:hypothetical protein
MHTALEKVRIRGWQRHRRQALLGANLKDFGGGDIQDVLFTGELIFL